MLQIKELSVSVDNKEVLKQLNLNILDGETHVIMGPNGTGKSTLSRVILGDKKYLKKGSIIYNNEDITNLSTDTIARKGIFLLNQNPLEIDGISNSEFLRTATSCNRDKPIKLYNFIKTLEDAAKDLKMDSSMLNRAINVGFSGGEKKKNEVLQLKVLKPNFIILDELDSGLDVDSLKIVCDNINEYKKENPLISILIITHYPKILELLKPDYVNVLIDGKLVKTGDISLAREIEKKGYQQFLKNSISTIGVFDNNE